MKTTIETKDTKFGTRLPRLGDDGELPDAVAAAGRGKSPKARPAGARGAQDFKKLAADILPIPEMEGRPNPVELQSPINPEGGRKQSVESHRNLFCGHYDACLDEAVKHGWNSFTCVRCSFYRASEEETEGGVERFATQRRAS